MYKVTVMYNLPPGADHAEFIRWRTGPHQAQIMQMPGLLRYDFYRIDDSDGRPAPYTYMSELYFPDRQSFEQAFYEPGYQARLQVSLQRVVGHIFLMSQELLTEDAPKREAG